MGDLFEYSLHFQGVHFLHFGSDEHGLDSDYVQLSGYEHISAGPEEPIHDFDASEVGFVLEVVRSHDFNHPVQHTGS